MKKYLLPLVIGFVLGVFLLGCSEGQITSFRSALEQKEKDVAAMRLEVDHLKKLAAESHDAQLADAADKADQALVLAEQTLPAMRKQLEGMKSGSIVSVIAGAFLPFILPRLAGLIPVVGPLAQAFLANVHWNATATKEQKLADAGTPS